MSICVENTKLALEQSTWLSLQEYGRALASPCLSHLSSLLHFHSSDSSAAQTSIPGKTISRLLCLQSSVGGKESEKINVCPEELHFPALCCRRDSSRRKRKKKKKKKLTDQDRSVRWSATWCKMIMNLFFFAFLHLSYPFLCIRQSLRLPTSDAATVTPSLALSSFYIWHYSSACSPELL